MATLKLFYNTGFFKPVYSPLEYEIGEASRVVGSDKCVQDAYVISQEELSKPQADLFFHLWRHRGKIAFEDAIKLAIRLSIECANISNAEAALQALRDRESRRAEQELSRLAAKILRAAGITLPC